MTTTSNEPPRIEVSSARITRFNFADGNVKTATRESVAAEVLRMILDGTVENLTLENLHLLKNSDP